MGRFPVHERMRLATSQAQSLADRATSSRQPGDQPLRPYAFALTAREREVVAAVAAGQSNRQVAMQLAISEKTVKHHLTHIFDKLGVSSRLAVALLAMDHPELTLRTSAHAARRTRAVRARPAPRGAAQPTRQIAS